MLKSGGCWKQSTQSVEGDLKTRRSNNVLLVQELLFSKCLMLGGNGSLGQMLTALWRKDEGGSRLSVGG